MFRETQRAASDPFEWIHQLNDLEYCQVPRVARKHEPAGDASFATDHACPPEDLQDA